MSVTREYIAAGKRRVNHVQARWVGGEAFEAGHPERPWIHIDASGKTGPGPVETLLCALATCSAVDVVSILEKRRTPVATLLVDVHGERADAIPARLTAVQLIFRVTGEGIEREQAERAIDLAVNKYCSVGESLDPAIPIDLLLELNGEPAAPIDSAHTGERAAGTVE
jgi:putative redox protein